MKQIVQIFTHSEVIDPEEEIVHDHWSDTVWTPEELPRARREFPDERYRLITVHEN